MARIRTIKPEFFTSLTVASLPVEARLTFIGLWTHVDDEGRCVDDARLVKAAVWPLDDRLSADVEADLRALTEASLILRYKVGGRSFIAIRNWGEHQRINRPTKSKLPPPPPTGEPGTARQPDRQPPAETPGQATETTELDESSRSPHTQLSEDSRQERNREQGTGKGSSGTSPYLGHPRARDLDTPPPSDETPSLVEQLLTEYREESPRGISSKVAAALAAEIHQLLRDNFHPDHIREGLWQLRPRKLGPGALASLVDEIANRPAVPAGNVVALRGDQSYIGTSDRKVAQVDAVIASIKARAAQNGDAL